MHRSLDDHKARLAAGGSSADDHDLKEDDEHEGPATAESGTGEIYAQPEGDEDRVLKNTRPARSEDGLLTLDELKSMYIKYGKGAYSVYGQNLGRIADQSGNWYGEREGKPAHTPASDQQEQRIREGYYEPAWTNGAGRPLLMCNMS